MNSKGDEQPEEKQVAVPLSPRREVVKSTAMVEWSRTRFPMPFTELSHNTNLNDTPSNWLRGHTSAEEQLRDLPWQRERSEFSSFAMANWYPDYAGEVDVVSDAENIKMLLKIPLVPDSYASLMVHRVGRTLLLDYFDVHKHLLRQETENWKWMRNFFKDTVLKDACDLKCIPGKSRKQDVLQNRIMYSKFLYHSLAGNDCKELELCRGERRHDSSSPNVQLQHFVADQPPNTGKFGGQEFRTETLWTFEDIRMLIGADLPIFSVGDHPCVSLRLRDAAQPINVMTGLDYWLDNLMCNVPEVAMCYHHNGFVQKYELIKTEDIPKLEGSNFDPQLVKDIACNILSFLRNSATKEGHTYWLYKCKRSDTVKLYDLSLLCGDSVPQEGATPFTMPLGMLLYRVARNMRQSGDHFKIAQIKALLQNSLRLLNDEEHAQVCTSSYYLLSDLYLPDSCIHNRWVDESQDDTSEQSSESDDDAELEVKAELSVEVKELCRHHCTSDRTPRHIRLEGISGTPDERCKDGLQYVRKGLNCLERDFQIRLLLDRRTNSSIVEEQHTCDSNKAIPLKYEPISKGQASDKNTSLQLSTPQTSRSSWHQLSKALLLRKACMANYVLVSEFLSNLQYGCALKHVRYAIHCYEAMARLVPSKKAENKELLILILLAAAEARHFLGLGACNLEEHQRGYDDMSEEDASILDRAQSVLTEPELAWTYRWTNYRGENLHDSLRCLDHIRDLVRLESANFKEILYDVTKKICAVCNELGKLGMAHAETLLRNESTFSCMQKVWTDSKVFMERGVEGFHELKDPKNEALVLLNIARLHRVAAQALTLEMQNSGKEFTADERSHFKDAFNCFQKALDCLGSDHAHRDLRDRILWDFSTCNMHMGTLLQDYPPISSIELADIAREVMIVFHKAIKLCNKISNDCQTKTLCPYRIATLERRLGALHFKCAKEEITEGKRKHLISLAESSYKRAVEYFSSSDSFYEMLESQAERIGLHDFDFLASSKTVTAKDKTLELLLSLLLDCEAPLKGLTAKSTVKETTECHDGLARLVDFFMDKVQCVLKQLLISAGGRKRLKGSVDEKEILKSLYNNSLRVTDENRCEQLLKLLHDIRNQYLSQIPK